MPRRTFDTVVSSVGVLGQTLGGLLLTAYPAAVVISLLTVLGFRHLGTVSLEEQILAPRVVAA